jgi:hypothetical protein
LFFARDPNKKPRVGLPSFSELPAGNTTNAYNVVYIDWLTGRARALQTGGPMNLNSPTTSLPLWWGEAPAEPKRFRGLMHSSPHSSAKMINARQEPRPPAGLR